MLSENEWILDNQQSFGRSFSKGEFVVFCCDYTSPDQLVSDSNWFPSGFGTRINQLNHHSTALKSRFWLPDKDWAFNPTVTIVGAKEIFSKLALLLCLKWPFLGSSKHHLCDKSFSPPKHHLCNKSFFSRKFNYSSRKLGVR